MDTIRVEVLADGTLKVTTDRISQPNHMSADALLKGVDELMGGPASVAKRKDVTHHHHSHSHGHDKEVL